jgi:hypothetical protein
MSKKSVVFNNKKTCSLSIITDYGHRFIFRDGSVSFHLLTHDLFLLSLVLANTSVPCQIVPHFPSHDNV